MCVSLTGIGSRPFKDLACFVHVSRGSAFGVFEFWRIRNMWLLLNFWLLGGLTNRVMMGEWQLSRRH